MSLGHPSYLLQVPGPPKAPLVSIPEGKPAPHSVKVPPPHLQRPAATAPECDTNSWDWQPPEARATEPAPPPRTALQRPTQPPPPQPKGAWPPVVRGRRQTASTAAPTTKAGWPTYGGWLAGSFNRASEPSEEAFPLEAGGVGAD